MHLSAVVALLAAAVVGASAQCGASSYSAGTDYFSSKVSVSNATLFSVQYASSYKIVTATLGSVNDTYVLYQRGTPKPALTNMPANTKYFVVPVRSIAVTGSTTVDYIYNLKADDLIVYATKQYILNQCVVVRNLTDVPTAGFSTNYTAMSNVDVIFDDSLQQRNISNVVADISAREPGMVASTEWIEFFSLFFNFEARALTYANTVQTSLLTLQSSIKNLPAKKCAWFTYNGYQYLQYYTPFQISRNKAVIGADGAFAYSGCSDYFATAGFTDNNDFDTKFYNNATFANEFVCQLDYMFVNAYGLNSTVNANDSSLFFQFLTNNTHCPVVANKAVYNTDKRINDAYSTDFFESRLVEGPNFVQDMISIAHENVLTNYTRRWLRNVFTESAVIVNSTMCTYFTNGVVNLTALPASGLLPCRSASNDYTAPSAAAAIVPSTISVVFGAIVLAFSML